MILRVVMEIRSWIFIFLIVPYSYGIQLRETEYECGAHGRFEYCIDGVPGCVIGCHCHPGYYFDTATKICEPNIKLSQNFRRNYDIEEPTRVFIQLTSPAIEETTTITSKNAVDEKIDIITKDADDLGDWLYNQFFKTIENQVMNETKDDSVITRRSDNSPNFVKKPSRRSRKYWKSKRKKKRKKKGLKSKLLRITEDDSLFDSSSDSTSDESSDSSDSFSDSESFEDDGKPKKHHVNDDHGHKKIVVFNKRPKPPLPSFIFLPNMETPFFPPLGLPAPPMPMYPMVPVPPMAFPFPAPTPPCDNGPNKTNGQASAPPTQETPAGTTSPANKPAHKDGTTLPADENPADNGLPDENPDEPDPNAPNETPPEDVPPDAPDDEKPSDPTKLRSRPKKRRGPRKNLVQKLRDKLKRKNKLQNYFANGYQGPPIVPPGFSPKHLPNLRQIPNIEDDENFPGGLQDVDFKYLSQLIHRADLNKTSQSLPTPIPTQNLQLPLPSRRNLDGYAGQITQALNNLANQPNSRNLDIQPELDFYNQISHNVSNQPGQNPASQTNYKSSNQLNYNSPNYLANDVHKQIVNNVPSLPIFNLPRQLSYNIPQPAYNILRTPASNTSHMPDNAPYQTADNTLRQLPNNAPRQPSDNGQHLPAFNLPSQSSFNVANQPTYVSLNQPPSKVPYRNKIEETNDSYYANLGRQIATMIRNIDGDKEVDIEIKSSLNIPNNPIPPEQTGPRSYWERSVRSPYTHILNSYKKQFDNLKSSNEELFKLESKVEMAASTEPTLSLQELENIVKRIQKAKSTFIKKGVSTRVKETSKTIFNVNLLPMTNQQIHFFNKNIKKTPPTILAELTTPNNALKDLLTKTMPTSVQVPPVKDSYFGNFMFTLKASEEDLIPTTPKTIDYQTSTYMPKIIPVRKSIPVSVPQMMFKMSKPFSYPYTALPPPESPQLTNKQPYYQPNIEARYRPATTSRPYYKQLNPLVLNHKAVKYYDGINNHQFLFEKAAIPVASHVFPTNRLASGKRYESYRKNAEPSYFHHEVHHFDYFEDLL